MIETSRRSDSTPSCITTWMLLGISLAVFGILTAGCDAPKASQAGVAKSSVSKEVALTPCHVLELSGHSVDLLAVGENDPLVVIFVRTDCPLGNRYAPTISRLYESYSQQGVRFALVYPDENESAEDIRQHVADYSLSVDAYRDPDRQFVSKVGATITPEAIVFDSGRRMVYRGRIDNRAIELGKERPRPTTSELQDVLDTIVSGATLEFSSTQSIGCFIE